MSFVHYFKTAPWILVQLICVLSFLGQICFLTKDQIKPSQTTTVVGETQLDQIDFPVLFKICFKNAFNLENLQKSGYSTEHGVWGYFTGASRFNKSLYGWAGHTPEGGVGVGVAGNQVE